MTLVSASGVRELLLEDEINPAPPKLKEVQLTVGAATKVAGNKKKINKWKSTTLKAVTKMYHAEQKKGEDGLSADQVEQTIKKRFEETGPSAQTITCYVNKFKLIDASLVKQGSPGHIPPAAFESLCVNIESYISINQLN
jgi:hypothetical protein